MSDYLDVVQFKKNERTGKWRRINLGYAKKNDKGQLDVYLDALPMPDSEGSCRITIAKREERQQGGDSRQSGGTAYGGTTGGAGDVDDEIPFAPEWRV